MSKKTSELVAELLKAKAKASFGPYISHIRFPNFKNIRREARIDFPFPVTALVGPNGCGKTSALHALYGAPAGSSTSDFWFTTEIDPILEGQGEPNRFVYGHLLDKTIVETRKARVGKSQHRKPGYFEPTKAVAGDKMDMSAFPATHPKKGQSKDRWNPVDRPLIHINFRSELSAFDKFFYFGEAVATPTLRTKQERIQRGAKQLERALRSTGSGAQLYGRRMLHEERELTKEELKAVSNILGKVYAGARLIRHSFYGNVEGLSVKFRTGSSTYSEAFAGSGEHSVVSLVIRVLAAKKHTLILLDEPEVSLHPGAQKSLLAFLLEQVLRHQHQLIFTTHSPSLIEFLPESAIKVFFPDEDGRFAVLESCHPYAAFAHIGAAPPGRVKILVEDRLAMYVTKLALMNLPESERELFDVDYLPGGSKTYLAHRIPTLMLTSSPPFVILDGDQRPLSVPTDPTDKTRTDAFKAAFGSPFATPFPDPAGIPSVHDDLLGELIEHLTDCKVQLGIDGGSGPAHELDKVRVQRKYLGFLHERVSFLPRRCPEEIVLAALGEAPQASSAESKKRLAALVTKALGEDASSDIDSWCRISLSTHREANADLLTISRHLRGLLPSLRPSD